MPEIASPSIHIPDDPQKGECDEGSESRRASLCLSYAATAQERQFDLSAMDAVHGIPEFARQAGIQIVAPADDLGGISTPAIHGNLDVRVALRRLLVGTDLEIASDDGAVITLRRIKPAKQSGNPIGSSLRSVDDRKRLLDRAGTESQDLAEIVVTAQKRSERLQDVPVSISVLMGAQLDASTFLNTKDALNSVPGLATLTDQNSGGTVLSLRGVSSTGAQFAGTTPIAYYLDGVPFALVRSALVPDANIYDLQRIEVLEGPQGTLYGASALNGVIRILTNDPDLANFDFKARVGTSDTYHGGGNYEGDVAINVPIIDNLLAARFVAGEDYQSGWIKTDASSQSNDTKVENERLKIAAQPTDSLSIGLSAWHSQVISGGPAYSDSSYNLQTPYPFPDSNTFNTFGLNIDYSLPYFTISSKSSYLAYNNSGYVDFSVFSFDFGLQNNDTTHVYSEELNLTSKGEGPWKWSAGTFYRDARDYTHQSFVFHPQPATFGDAFSDTSESAAVYGEVGAPFFKIIWSCRPAYDTFMTMRVPSRKYR